MNRNKASAGEAWANFVPETSVWPSGAKLLFRKQIWIMARHRFKSTPRYQRSHRVTRRLPAKLGLVWVR